MSEKKVEEPRTASDGHVLVVLYKSGCGELKRRRHRSDALGWQRERLKQHPKHEVEIIEKPEAAKPAKGKSAAAKPAKKGKAKKAPKAEAQKEAAA